MNFIAILNVRRFNCLTIWYLMAAISCMQCVCHVVHGHIHQNNDTNAHIYWSYSPFVRLTVAMRASMILTIFVENKQTHTNQVRAVSIRTSCILHHSAVHVLAWSFIKKTASFPLDAHKTMIDIFFTFQNFRENMFLLIIVSTLINNNRVNCAVCSQV